MLFSEWIGKINPGQWRNVSIILNGKKVIQCYEAQEGDEGWVEIDNPPPVVGELSEEDPKTTKLFGKVEFIVSTK